MHKIGVKIRGMKWSYKVGQILKFYKLHTICQKSSKCQTKSKRVFQADVSSKKWTNEFYFTTMKPQVDLLSFVFWKKLKTPKRHFEINWPLWAGSIFFPVTTLLYPKLLCFARIGMTLKVFWTIGWTEKVLFQSLVFPAFPVCWQFFYMPAQVL